MADIYEGKGTDLHSPIRFGATVTPSDSTDLPNDTRALWVGTGGSVAIITAGGSTITLANVTDGAMLPIRVSRVLAATTASGIVALW